MSQVREELHAAATATRDGLDVVVAALRPSGSVGGAGAAFVKLGPLMAQFGEALERWGAALDEAKRRAG